MRFVFFNEGERDSIEDDEMPPLVLTLVENLALGRWWLFCNINFIRQTYVPRVGAKADLEFKKKDKREEDTNI